MEAILGGAGRLVIVDQNDNVLQHLDIGADDGAPGGN